ncbi:hypothetical protein CR513_19882, partial [Mucuna pruriens]
MDRSMIDAASGGALMDKMLAAARHLISNMASNTQQFGIRGAIQPRMVNEIGAVDNLTLENQLTELTSLVRKLAVGQHQPSIAARVCGICNFVEHPTNMCPTLQETESDYLESIGVVGGYQYGKQPYQSRPSDNQYLSQGPYVAQRFGPGPNAPQGPAITTSNLEFQQTMSSNNMQFQQSMNATIQDLKMQIGQLANTVSQRLETSFITTHFIFINMKYSLKKLISDSLHQVLGIKLKFSLAYHPQTDDQTKSTIQSLIDL